MVTLVIFMRGCRLSLCRKDIAAMELGDAPWRPVFPRSRCVGCRAAVLAMRSLPRVVRLVLGLDAKDLARTASIEIEGVTDRISPPHLILKAKLANAALIDQEGRQDVKHARMMRLCVRAFIVELSGTCRSGRLGERRWSTCREKFGTTQCHHDRGLR